MNLKDMREKKGLSQKELARLSGISARTISRYESGETEPDPERSELLHTLLAGSDGEQQKTSGRNENRLCPYRTNIGDRGGIVFSRCLGGKCMGYVSGACILIQHGMRDKKNVLG